MKNSFYFEKLQFYRKFADVLYHSYA